MCMTKTMHSKLMNAQCNSFVRIFHLLLIFALRIAESIKFENGSEASFERNLFMDNIWALYLLLPSIGQLRKIRKIILFSNCLIEKILITEQYAVLPAPTQPLSYSFSMLSDDKKEANSFPKGENSSITAFEMI